MSEKIWPDPGLEARRRFEDEALAAERACAIRAAYDGVRTALLSVLAEDSVLGGAGLEPGRAAYEALPQDYQERLLWEPTTVAASADGTLAFTAGPYRMLDGIGNEKGAGVYLSVWRRHKGSGHFELVLDFSAEHTEFPMLEDTPRRLCPSAERAGAMEPFLAAFVREGSFPPAGQMLRLGEATWGGHQGPAGFLVSEDGELGVLWGTRARAHGSLGAYAIVLGPGGQEPISLASIQT